MNMFAPTAAKNRREYLDQLSPERREMIQFLDTLIQKTVPTLRPTFATNMLGYGSFPYRNYKKEPIEWPVIALASQKNYVSLYVCALYEGEYLAEKFKDDLGTVSVGKSCIRFKKIEDINLVTLKKILKLAAKFPGLVSARDKKASTNTCSRGHEFVRSKDLPVCPKCWPGRYQKSKKTS